MKRERFKHQLCLLIIRSSEKRTNYLKRHCVFHECGDNVILQSRKIPLYPKLISFHNNIRIASDVSFITHDVIDRMLNIKYPEKHFVEQIGCIEIMDNVFIGSNSSIMYNVRIGPNVIVAAGSLVTKNIPPGEVWGGVPAKKLGNFKDLVEKRKSISFSGKHPMGETISNELEQYMWSNFLNSTL